MRFFWHSHFPHLSCFRLASSLPEGRVLRSFECPRPWRLKRVFDWRIAKTIASYCHMFGSWRLVKEAPAKGTSKRDCCYCRSVPTPSCRSFRGLSSRRVICGRTKVICHQCRNAARIAAGDRTTLLRRHQVEIEGPHLRAQQTHQSEPRCRCHQSRICRELGNNW